MDKAPSKRATGKTAKIPSLMRDAQITSQINLAARLTNQAARIRLGSLGAWPAQIPILLWLLEEDGIIQKELVKRARVEQSTIAEHLDRMERDGLLYRERGEEDKRKVQIFVTDKARRMSKKLLSRMESGARLFTKDIDKDDLETFSRVIAHIIENLDRFIEKNAKSVA